MPQRVWLRAWKKGGWIRRLSSPTFATSTVTIGLASWISLLRATRAKEKATPADAQVPIMSSGSGRTSSASFAKYDRRSSSWKTLQLTLDGASETWSATWPRAGGMSNGIASRRQPSAPLTAGIASSFLLPTPSASQGGSQNNGRRSDGSSFRTKGTPTLAGRATKGMLPTPMASDATAGGRNSWGTPKLPTMAKEGLLPTPTSSDAKRGGSDGRRPGSKSGITLDVACGGPLNPQFVEWMMGWPIDWTDCT